MSTVFVGGSRHITHLSPPVIERLKNMIDNHCQVLVGDANGVDKAVQKFFAEASYSAVTVYCSGDHYRNNLGRWTTRCVAPPKGVKGFQFYAAKDREMALAADVGLMIWDGKSPGTALNALRLIQAGKIAVIFDECEKRQIKFKSAADWNEFLAAQSEGLRWDLKERATSQEWEFFSNRQGSFFEQVGTQVQKPTEEECKPGLLAPQEQRDKLNSALESADLDGLMNELRQRVNLEGLGQIAMKSGLSTNTIKRSLEPTGTPKFQTILRIMFALNLRLQVSETTQQGE